MKIILKLLKIFMLLAILLALPLYYRECTYTFVRNVFKKVEKHAPGPVSQLIPDRLTNGTQEGISIRIGARTYVLGGWHAGVGCLLVIMGGLLIYIKTKT